MNVEQALNAADESDTEGLRGLYPTAAQVLAAEVRQMRSELPDWTEFAEWHHKQVEMEAANNPSYCCPHEAWERKAFEAGYAAAKRHND